MTRPMRLVTLSAVIPGWLGGCGRSEPTAMTATPNQAPTPAVAASWTVLSESDLSASQTEQQQLAVRARDAMFSRLMGRLEQILRTGSASEAIPICRNEAPQIAQEVAAEHHVKIGRTSTKLRNPSNQPPDWAAELIRRQPQSPTYLADQHGRFAALLPIRLKAQCLTCHGPEDRLSAEVRSVLNELYPTDRAVGYAEGDLRGWFWVEVPARR